MKEIIHQMLLGMGAVFFAPFGAWPPPTLRITLPPEDATRALAYDFAQVAGDFHAAIAQEEQKGVEQLELRM